MAVKAMAARIATSLVNYLWPPAPAPERKPVPAPRGDDVLRTRSGSVELIVSAAALSQRNFRVEAAGALLSSCFGLLFAVPICFGIAVGLAPDGFTPASALFASSGALLCYAVLVVLQMPRALRIGFAPVPDPAYVRVVRWWRTRRISVYALSGITVIEYRYRPSGATAAGDAQRETISTLPYRIDAVLHRVAGGSWTVRGSDGGWKPDPRDMYGPLADLLAPAGLTVDRQVTWIQRPVTYTRWFSPGSGGANSVGGCL